MKVGILAGGLGTRLAEETEIRPKPMVEVGGRPILWHIMRYYAHFGHNEFAVACGYKAEYINRWFADLLRSGRNLTIDFEQGEIRPHDDVARDIDWTVDLVDTGLSTGTGGRIKRLQPYLGDDTFMITWGDGVADVDLDRLVEFHRSHGKLCTLTAVRPPARFGHIEMDGDRIVEFNEKPQTGEGWINGAFFVMEQGVFDYIGDDASMFERGPLERLAMDGELMAFRHGGFWQCMDTLRDKKRLEALWTDGAPWRVWSD